MYLWIQMSCQWGALFCVWPRTETSKGSPITSKDQIQCPQHTQPTSLIHLLASFLAYLFPLSTALDILNYTLFSKHTIFKICSHIHLIPQFANSCSLTWWLLSNKQNDRKGDVWLLCAEKHRSLVILLRNRIFLPPAMLGHHLGNGELSPVVPSKGTFIISQSDCTWVPALQKPGKRYHSCCKMLDFGWFVRSL